MTKVEFLENSKRCKYYSIPFDEGWGAMWDSVFFSRFYPPGQGCLLLGNPAALCEAIG